MDCPVSGRGCRHCIRGESWVGGIKMLICLKTGVVARKDKPTEHITYTACAALKECPMAWRYESSAGCSTLGG